ncbi:hypothetical protein D3C87_1514430 [compost metagenome]
MVEIDVVARTIAFQQIGHRAERLAGIERRGWAVRGTPGAQRPAAPVEEELLIGCLALREEAEQRGHEGAILLDIARLEPQPPQHLPWQFCAKHRPDTIEGRLQLFDARER